MAHKLDMFQCNYCNSDIPNKASVIETKKNVKLQNLQYKVTEIEELICYQELLVILAASLQC
jgi:hypothetical protein